MKEDTLTLKIGKTNKDKLLKKANGNEDRAERLARKLVIDGLNPKKTKHPK